MDLIVAENGVKPFRRGHNPLPFYSANGGGCWN